ncbi:MAG: DHH family phosphoesterase [Candidatus Falkowbacteria bacterium]|nr:DHH family phosphoesterase [Candidatus Falkowbacteria bacterium]
MPTEKFQSALAKIREAKNILLTIHSRPDGDAISSLCLLIELLINEKKDYTAYSQDPIPRSFFYLPHIEKIITDRNQFNFSDFDLIIALDCGQLTRSGLAEEIKNKLAHQSFIEFDHHPQVENYAEIANRYPDYASTTEVLYYFLKSNKIPLNKNYANCILTGLLTDTGNFLFPVTSDQSINIASEMLLYGARFPLILESTWRNKSLGTMRLWGRVLSSLEINEKYNLAFCVIRQNEILENNASEEELESLSNFISNLHDVKAILVINELDAGEVKGSLRATQSNIDVSRLARLLGGGGHKKAAGFKIKGELVNDGRRWKVK